MGHPNKPKRTPGPWKKATYNNDIYGSESVQTNGWPEDRIVKGPGGRTISNRSYAPTVCKIYGNTDLPGPSANCDLILAAPDLLEAAEMVIKELDEANSYRVHLELKPTEYEFMPKLKAAVDKAKGRESK